MYMIVTKVMLDGAKSIRGGYSKEQVNIGLDLYGKGWGKKMLGSNILESDWLKFSKARNTKKGKLAKYKANKKKVINPMTTKKDDWSWKPELSDIPAPKSKNHKARGKKKAKRKKVSKLENKDFYLSREWRELRVRVLEKYECKCMMCGQSPKIHGIVIHVDHIKPRSKYPELSLTFENLQLLCEACNLGKSNKYQTDWRPDVKTVDEMLDLQLLAEAPAL